MFRKYRWHEIYSKILTATICVGQLTLMGIPENDPQWCRSLLSLTLLKSMNPFSTAALRRRWVIRSG
jgi:hypothetical protein